MTTEDALYVVPAERHVERLAGEGRRAESRSSLRERLAVALLPGVRFADRAEVRLALGVALEELAGRRGQLDLFGSGGSESDPLLASMRARGGASWVRAVSAIDEALGTLRRRGVSAAELESLATGPKTKNRRSEPRAPVVAARRAAILGAAMRELDGDLARVGLRDGRALGGDLAAAIREASPRAVSDAVGAGRLRARWILTWDLDDLAWWRALDEALASLKGFARIVLPAFDKRLEGSRERDPLEVLADGVARHLDAAPETETIPAVLGDLASVAPELGAAAPELRLVRANDTAQQASIVAALVRDALEAGASVERIVVAYPSRDERTLFPLRRALEDDGVVYFDAFGAAPSTVPVVATALHALEVVAAPTREGVARLLRSGYIDAPRLLDETSLSFRDADRILARFAHALETHATATGADDGERLVRTIVNVDPRSEPDASDRARVERVVGVLLAGRAAASRLERVRAARRLLSVLGLGARAGRGALATFARDEAPAGVDRAERLAVARDVRAWEAFEGALDTYELASLNAPKDPPIDAEVFRLELVECVETSTRSLPLPSGGRAGAVRLARLADIAGEELDLLVVVDANEGVLPRDAGRNVTLVSESLEENLARASARPIVRDPSEQAARELGALATCAAASERVVFVTTGEGDGADPTRPARVFVMLEQAGVVPSAGPARRERARRPASAGVARRLQREHRRELFFLDPARPRSDEVGALTATATIRETIAAETGASQARALAVTSVERFAQCAFKGYAHVVLAAREGDEQHELPDAREEGNLGHAALAAAFVATSDEWPRRPRSSASILERGLAAADGVLATAAVHAPLRAIVRLRIRESVRVVLLRAIDDVEWNFAFAEQPFRQVEMGDAETALWLRGTIDRIDRAHTTLPAYRVIDYKRSKSTVRDSTAMLGETALQVPIYAVLASRRFEARATGAYVPMLPRDLALEPAKATARAEAKVTELATGDPPPAQQRVLDVIAAARAGRFAPVPARESECTRCSVSGGCRKPRFAMAPADEEEGEVV